ncbi:LysR family transcriptional regulator [Patulibacter sp. NPDC049589]|uniref:LysR family transcriptional regulator n=1 Tax=Patulibacter sp. NPDC049589 TaxID=3154731 RepID=UPI00342D594B
MDDAEQIAAFVAAADELHLGRAAATLGLTGATVARRLRALESRLGLSLVDRRHRCRISLTQAGAALLPDARRMVAAAAQVGATAQAIREGRMGVVRVAVISEPDAEIDALAETLRDVDPGWSVDVRRLDRREAGRQMGVGGLEVVIGRHVAPVPTGPSLVDPRPCRLERMRGLRVGAGEPGWLAVAWRASWEGSPASWEGPPASWEGSPASWEGSPASADALSAPAGGARLPAIPASAGGPPLPVGSEHAREFVRAAMRLRQDDLDARFPRRAAQRRELEVRRAAVAAELELRRRERAELGAEAALARSQERSRAETIRRYREACDRGAVELHLAIDYWALEGPDRLYWATFGAEDPASRPESSDGSSNGCRDG